MPGEQSATQMSHTTYRLIGTFSRRLRKGFTLIELMIGAAVLAIAIVALMGAFLGQITLNEHARNLTLAINDANRVMERLRQQNSGSGCGTPSIATPNECDPGSSSACTDSGNATPSPWNQWLNDSAGGGKSIQQSPSPDVEYVDVRCLKPGTTTACGATDDPIQITVSLCWTHRGRTIPGAPECTYALGPGWTSTPGANGVVDSPAMLTTLMTCRQ